MIQVTKQYTGRKDDIHFYVWTTRKTSLLVDITTSIMSDTNSTLPIRPDSNFGIKRLIIDPSSSLDRTVDLMKPIITTENNGLMTLKPCSVSISGASGQLAARINGIYEPTDEFAWELPVYVMVGNPTRCLEYYFLTKSWQTKATEYKGTNIRYVSLPLSIYQ